MPLHLKSAATAGVTYIVSMAATTSIEEIAQAAPTGRRWMQAYLRRDRGITRASLERAAAAGCLLVASLVSVNAAAGVAAASSGRPGPPPNVFAPTGNRRCQFPL